MMSTTSRAAEPVVVDLPAGLDLTVRAFRDATDYAPMAALMRVANTADGIPWLPTDEQFRTETEGADGLVPADDIVLVEGPDGLVAFSTVHRIVRDGVPNYDMTGYVRPDHRRRGIGGALFRHDLKRIEARVAVEDPDADVRFRAHAEEHEVGLHRLLTDHGFTAVRQFFLMRRPDLDGTPEVPLPDGLELRRVTPSQHRAIWEAEAEAFQDHWGAHQPTEHDFEVTFSQSALDTDLWAVAWDGDEVAGVVQAWIWAEENESLGVKYGWLEKISVRRPWRKRGLGAALTAAAMAHLRDAGMTEAMLGVDSQNPSGALGLYERLGFDVAQRSAAWELPFRLGTTEPSRDGA